MQTVQLGRSSLTASRLAYGCWRIAGTWEAAKVTPEAAADGRKAVAAAFEMGYTLFDLADIYCDGVCEKIFGQALKEISGMRKRVLIATKCGIRKRGDPNPDSPYRYDFSAEHIVRSCEQSLKRLGAEGEDRGGEYQFGLGIRVPSVRGHFGCTAAAGARAQDLEP